MRQFSKDPQLTSFPTLMVFDSLGILSLLPILKMFVRLGSIQIHYVSASSLSLKIITLLKFFGVVGECFQIKDYWKIDTKYSKFHEAYYIGFELCHPKLKEIEQAVDNFFPGLSKYSKNLLVMGVKTELTYRMTNLIWMQAFTEELAKEINIPFDRVAVVSVYADLFNEMQSDANFPHCPVPVFSQPIRNRVFLGLGWGLFRSFKDLCWSIRGSFARLFLCGRDISKLSINKHLSMFAFAAIWGVNDKDDEAVILDDLNWWRESDISGERLVYFYDRPDFQPTEKKIGVMKSMGVQSLVWNDRCPGDSPDLIVDKYIQKSAWISIREICQMIKWSFRTLRLKVLGQFTIAQSIFHLVGAKWLCTYLKALNIKGLVHYQQASADWYSLAAELTDGCRFGFAKSYICFLSDMSMTAQVFFSWGANDARVYMDTGGISKHLLIGGCPIPPPQKKAQEKHLRLVSQIRKKGAKYVLALFDSSFESKVFYVFFLSWLLKDPNLGLIIKSKGSINVGSPWLDIQADGLDGLVENAFETGRLHIADAKASPADVATVVDFSVGIGSYSAVTLSALNGARVLLVDFERLDQGVAAQSTFLLHSLGPNRCVFYEFDSVKNAILEYADNPESNPELGNASPVLDLIDPFRDGLAGQRMGEYIKWYLDGRDQGLNRDGSLLQATEKYAAKWG